MTIKPIDIVKTQEVSQYKQLQNQRYQHEQVQISKNFQNMVQAEQSKPVETNRSEHREFRYDAKEEGGNQYRGSGRKGKQDKGKKGGKDEHANMSKRPGGIDILI